MSLFHYIQQGGLIMYILIAFNIIGMALMLVKFLSFSSEKKSIDQIAQSLSDNIKTDDKAIEAIIELSKQEINFYITKLENGLGTIKVIASISPLLGLLGTVLGVLIAFKVMSQTGLSNPATFAEGIAMALITTVGGMIVAIPHYIGHNYLIGMLDNLEASIEKKLVNKIL